MSPNSPGELKDAHKYGASLHTSAHLHHTIIYIYIYLWVTCLDLKTRKPLSTRNTEKLEFLKHTVKNPVSAKAHWFPLKAVSPLPLTSALKSDTFACCENSFSTREHFTQFYKPTQHTKKKNLCSCCMFPLFPPLPLLCTSLQCELKSISVICKGHFFLP